MRLGVAQRRARLGRRHRLIPATRARTPLEATEAMVVLHATDPATVYLSLLGRLVEPELSAIERALYEQREVIRLLAMRRTLFVAPRRLLEMVERAASDHIAARERRRLCGFLEDSGLGDGDAWLDDVWDETAAAMREAGEGLLAKQIGDLVPRLATKIRLGGKSKWGVDVNATSKVLGQWASEGRLIRGRPAGTWTSRLHQWHLRDDWLGERVDNRQPEWDEASAAVELVRRWLETFGPGTFDDLKWWTGWTVSKLRAALAELDVLEVEMEGAEDAGGTTVTGLVLADDVESEHDAAAGTWAALLPALDPTPMGWKERDWFLGPHASHLFDRNGNIGPTIWLDGRIVGGWSQLASGEIVSGLLEDIGSDAETLIEGEVERLQAVLGDTVVKPSFPTPLQRELEAGA